MESIDDVNLDNIHLTEVLNNLGIGLLCQRKEIINNGKKKEYYQIVSADLGYKILDGDFISLKAKPYEIFGLGFDRFEDEFILDFQKLKDIKRKDIMSVSDKYQDSIGRCFVYEAKNKRLVPTDLDLPLDEDKEIIDLPFPLMYQKIKDVIIAQDEQIRQILVSIYKNLKLINSFLDKNTIAKLKENIIVYGPTGTGKTEILTQIAKLSGVPIVIEDITSFSETGYVGRDVSDMLADLYAVAGYDLEKAQKGILVIDEFDKLADGGVDGGMDGPSRTGVQRSLLKLLDGGSVSFSEDKYDGDSINFDTSNLTVVALGAFSGIKKTDNYSDVSSKDFTDYGIMREVMGRFSKFVMMNSLGEKELKEILLKSNLSPLNTYEEMFSAWGINFTYDENIINYIIAEALALNLGARSLKATFDELISEPLYEVLADDKNEVHLKVPTDKSKSHKARQKAYEESRKVGFI